MNLLQWSQMKRTSATWSLDVVILAGIFLFVPVSGFENWRCLGCFGWQVNLEN
jgi:hypothetical protein